MFSTADKTHHASAAHQKAASASFFRKAGEGSFFGGTEMEGPNSFFSPVVQTKLSVSSPDDPQEKEADAVAEQVMRMPEPVAAIEKKEEGIQKKEEEEETVQTKATLSPRAVARKCDHCQKEEKEKGKAQPKLFRLADRSATTEGQVEDDNMEAVTGIDRKPSLYRSDTIQLSGRGPPTSSIPFEDQLAASRGGGNPLPDSTKQFMESRFQADFSGVRIHTGSHAENLSSQIHAQAFAHGNDIYFNTGKYSPHSEAGGSLLAHELTHTIQQGASKPGIVHSKSSSSPIHSSSPHFFVNTKTNSIQKRGLNESLISPGILSGRTGGTPLPEGARDYLQDYYKTNLSDIRIHRDNEAIGLCLSQGTNSFVQGKDIYMLPSAYNPDSEKGAIALSEQVSKSLKQRGIKTTGADGNDNGSISSLINQIIAAVKENKESENKNPSNPQKAAAEIPVKEAKKEAAKKETKAGKKDSKSKKGNKKAGKKNADGPSFKPVKRDPKKSPRSPAEDPAFLRVVSKTKKTAKNQRDHEPAETKSKDAQNNADAVPKEAESKAQNRKTDGMGGAAAEDKPFDAASFKADLLKKIESITPKTLEEATEFKENNKIGEVRNVMGQKVATEKENTTGPIDKATAEPLQVNEAENKKPLPLPPTNQGVKPAGPGAQLAVPKNKMDGEISMQEQSQSLDDEMKKNNVSEEQLASSNEPSFNDALNEKRSAQKDAAAKPQQYRKEEALALKEAKTEAVETSAHSIAGMHNARGKNFQATVAQQKTTKQKDEERRAQVAIDIEAKYQVAEEKVKTALEEAETESNRIFDEGAEAARQQFENYVDEKMLAYKRRRYSGFWGGLKWAKDKLFGMPDEVNEFYKDGRQLYLDKMDLVIDEVANIVTLKLNDAKQAITDGKKDIDEYVKKLPQDLQDVGKEAATNIQDKFDALEQWVNDKRNDLIDGLAKKYVDNVKQLDDRISELKEANKGLIDKAIGFLKKVWKVIKDLYNLFTTILARLASIIGIILDSPGGFFANLGKAFRMGFDNFKNKFLEYLELGLMEWLATNLGIAGIELPQKFDAAAVFSLALQVMGITKVHIRERAVALLGERKVKLLENAGGLIYRVYNEGIGVIWDMIVEKLSDFKEMVWDAITSFIKKSIIEAALMFLLSLLNPIGAFIKVCMAIYDFLMMLVRFKDRIIELLDSILGAVMNIASGAVDAAAAMIEKALAKSVSVIIGFLAALLHLNNIFAKIREIITRIQKRVEKAIDWVIGKAYSLVGGLVEGALRLEDKATAVVEKGKDAIVGAGKKVAGAVLGWLNIKKEFTANDGKHHSLYFEGDGENAVLIIRSDPKPFTNFLNIYEAALGKDANTEVSVGSGKKTKSAIIADARVVAGNIEAEKRKEVSSYPGADDKAKEEAKKAAIDKLLQQLAVLSAPLFGTEKPLDNEIVLPIGSNNQQFASEMEAVNIYKTPKVINNGSAPTSAKHAIYDTIDNRQKGKASYYIRGHLINDNLGGPGMWNNMTALSRTGNHQHEGLVESKVKAAFDSGAVIRYKVKATGNQDAKTPAIADKKSFTKILDFDKNFTLLQNIINAEKKVATTLECEAYTRKKEGNVWTDDKQIVKTPVTNDVALNYDSYELGDNIQPPTVNLNTSDADQLARLAAIGPGRAAKIIAYRGTTTLVAPATRHFEKIEDLSKISGIGDATINALKGDPLVQL